MIIILNYREVIYEICTLCFQPYHFSSTTGAEAINDIAVAVKKSGHIPILPPEGIADDAGALRYADFLKNQTCDGVIAVFPNFGDESSTLTALRDFGKPILFVACSDKLNAIGAATRRDAFCGKISAVNLFRQCRIPCTVLEPHTIDPSGSAFQENLHTFAAVCRVTNGMKNLRTGSIVARCTPFKTVRFDETTLEKYHITNEAFDLSELFALIKTLKDEDDTVRSKRQNRLYKRNFLPTRRQHRL